MKKENINVWVERHLAKAFRETAKQYYNRMGMCLSASMLMFLEAHPKTQGEYLQKVFKAEIEDEVAQIVATAKSEQSRKIRGKGRSRKV